MSSTSSQPTDDPRLGQHIHDASQLISDPSRASETEYDLCIIGFPFDEGVRRNGGRVGARHGPEHFRKRLAAMGAMINLEHDIDLTDLRVADAGDVSDQDEEPLEEAHDKLTQQVERVIRDLKAIPFIVGGGNDQSYLNAMALLQTVEDRSSVGVINVDAHLDVRPKKEGLHHSGSPFRRLLETEGFQGSNFVEFGAQGTQCSAEHARFVTDTHKGRILWLSQLQRGGNTPLRAFRGLMDSMPPNVFLSFDLDAVRASDAPGVSSPGSIGLSAHDALDICFEAGRNPKIKMMDLSEFNPQMEGYITGKLVANMFIYFAMGLAMRKKNMELLKLSA